MAEPKIKNKKNKRFELVLNEMGMNYNYNIVIDKVTGVNYFFCKGTMGAGLCPVYNPDGTICVSEKDEQGRFIFDATKKFSDIVIIENEGDE